jgi:hypothetical protein
VFITNVKGTSGKIKCIGYHYNDSISSKQNTVLGVHSWEPDWKEIHNRRHIVSVAFSVNLSTYVGETDCYQYGSANIGTISLVGCIYFLLLLKLKTLLYEDANGMKL